MKQAKSSTGATPELAPCPTDLNVNTDLPRERRENLQEAAHQLLPFLSEALNSKDLAQDAALTVWQIGPLVAETFPAIKQLFEAEVQGRAFQAAPALASLGPKALEYLISAALNADDTYSKEQSFTAMQALSLVDPADLKQVPDLDSFLEMGAGFKDRRAKILLELPCDPSIKLGAVLRALGSHEENFREDGLYQLADLAMEARQLGSPLLEKITRESSPLIGQLLRDFQGEEVKTAIAYALAETQPSDPELTNELTNFLYDDSDSLRSAAALAIVRQGHFGQQFVMETALVESVDLAMRVACIEVLSEVTDWKQKCFDHLLELKEDSSPEIRAATALALSNLDHERALCAKLVIGLLAKETDEHALVAMIRALGSIADNLHEDLVAQKVADTDLVEVLRTTGARELAIQLKALGIGISGPRSEAIFSAIQSFGGWMDEQFSQVWELVSLIPKGANQAIDLFEVARCFPKHVARMEHKIWHLAAGSPKSEMRYFEEAGDTLAVFAKEEPMVYAEIMANLDKRDCRTLRASLFAIKAIGVQDVEIASKLNDIARSDLYLMSEREAATKALSAVGLGALEFLSSLTQSSAPLEVRRTALQAIGDLFVELQRDKSSKVL